MKLYSVSISNKGEYIITFSYYNRQRLMTMREMYQSSQCPDDDDLSSHLLLQTGDPFYDHSSWFRSIGHSYVFLSNLLVPVSLVRKVAIVGEKGEVKGHLTVSIRYMAGRYFCCCCCCCCCCIVVFILAKGSSIIIFVIICFFCYVCVY